MAISCYYLVPKSYQILATPWTVAHQAPLFMEFPRQEYWNGLLFPTQGDLSDMGIEPTFSALAGRFFTPELPGKPYFINEEAEVQGNYSNCRID